MRTKRLFFNKRIQEIASKNKKLWKLMNWVRKYKLSATEAIQFNGHLPIHQIRRSLASS